MKITIQNINSNDSSFEIDLETETGFQGLRDEIIDDVKKINKKLIGFYEKMRSRDRLPWDDENDTEYAILKIDYNGWF